MTLLISSVNSKKSAKHGVPSDGKNYCKLLLFASPENCLLMHDQALLRSININPYKSCPLMMMIPGDSQIRRFHLTTPMSTVDLLVCCRKGHLLWVWMNGDLKMWFCHLVPNVDLSRMTHVSTSRWWLQSIIRYPVASIEWIYFEKIRKTPWPLFIWTSFDFFLLESISLYHSCTRLHLVYRVSYNCRYTKFQVLVK